MSSKKWVQKILIVEDNVPTRKLMVKYFKKAKNNKHLQCDVFEASNGKEALTVIKKEHPDIVLSDISMPEMGGFELLQRFKADYSKDMPFCFFCFLSANKEDKNIAFEKGAMGFIPKDQINYFVFTLQLKSWLRLVFLERTLEIKRDLGAF